MLQRVKCGIPTCCCARPGGELHGRTGIFTEGMAGGRRAGMWGRAGRRRGEDGRSYVLMVELEAHKKIG